MITIELKIKIILTFIFILIAFNFFIYSFDKIAAPTVIAAADAEIRAKSLEIINKAILDEYSKEFNYDDIIHVEKDNEGNIVMLKADTIKMNKIASDVTLNAQKQLTSFGFYGVKIPMGYIFKNNILAYLGPSITVKMQPIGSIETIYESEFESAGINQTRHKIYVKFKTDLRVILPMNNNEIKIENEIPIAETVIVGKTPNTAVQLDLGDAGIKLNNPK